MASRLARRGLAFWLICLACGAAGCGGDRLESVEGKASVGGQPLTTGSLVCKPIADKGNTTAQEPAAQIDGQGVYKIYTAGRPGAPPGWYKVIVVAQEPLDPNAPYAPRNSLIDAKYNAESTTDLTIEVKAGAPAGHYDLTLKK